MEAVGMGDGEVLLSTREADREDPDRARRRCSAGSTATNTRMPSATSCRWRSTVDGANDSWNPIDSVSVLPDGTKVEGVAELKAALVARPERFATTIAERLLTYALGRSLEHYDAPVVRRIVAHAAHDGYRMQALIIGEAQSYPFVTRRSMATSWRR